MTEQLNIPDIQWNNTVDSIIMPNNPYQKITPNNPYYYNPSVGGVFQRYKDKLNGFIQNQRQDPNSLHNRGIEAKDQALNGWGNMSIADRAGLVLGTVGTLMNFYNQRKTAQLAKQQLNHAINHSNKNFDIQRKLTNSQLEDRQNRRVEEARANERTTMSVGDYMKKYGV